MIRPGTEPFEDWEKFSAHYATATGELVSESSIMRPTIVTIPVFIGTFEEIKGYSCPFFHYQFGEDINYSNPDWNHNTVFYSKELDILKTYLHRNYYSEYELAIRRDRDENLYYIDHLIALTPRETKSMKEYLELSACRYCITEYHADRLGKVSAE